MTIAKAEIEVEHIAVLSTSGCDVWSFVLNDHHHFFLSWLGTELWPGTQ